MNTGHTKLPAVCTAPMTPAVHLFPAGDTSNTFLDFWYYSVSFMAFLSHKRKRHSLSMQYKCHTMKNGEECVQNTLFVHRPSTEKTD
jgi:hypothetical protein